MTNTSVDVPAANAVLARHFFAEQDRLQGGPADALCAPGYRAVLGGNPPMDRNGHEMFATAFYAAFGGLHHTIEDVFATADRAAVRFVLHGTHTGDFFGVPATGRPITVAAHVLLRIEDGRVAALHGIFDEAGLFRQITAPARS